jgi:hypothetical protein
VNRIALPAIVLVAALVVVATAGVVGAEATRRAFENCTEGRPRTIPDPGITVDWKLSSPWYDCVYGTGPTTRREPPP